MSKSIYRFFVNCGRMGNLAGIFVADDEEMCKAIGKEVGFYDELGKHSEFVFALTWDYVKRIETIDGDFILRFEELKMDTGLNPLNHIVDSDEQDDEE